MKRCNDAQALVIAFLLSASISSAALQNFDPKINIKTKINSNSNSHEKPQRSVKDILYDDETSAIRGKLHQMRLETVEYARTGIHDHRVEYDFSTHPLSSDANLVVDEDGDENEDGNVYVDDSTRSLFSLFGKENNEDYKNPTVDSAKPLRITWFTEQLDADTTTADDAKRAVLINRILPAVAKFWSEALMVAPVAGNLKLDSDQLNQGYCIGPGLSKVPIDHLDNDGIGISDTDLAIYVSASNIYCGGGTLAVAGFCNNDQFDRPTAGAANVCMDSITLNADGTVSEASIEQFEVVLIHEVGHVLGFIANAFSLFWDTQTRQRRTPRPFEITNVKCVNGETITIKGFPSENTIQFIDDPLSSKRTAYLVTPRVKSVARNQFNCHDLEGAALENTPTMAGDCTGSHWDERLFYSESMSGIISPTTNIMSPLTLAYFEDTGWYLPNYAKSEISPFGHGAGCDFVRKPCLETNGLLDSASVPSYSRGSFCGNYRPGCSPSGHFKMHCDIIPNSPVPPPEFQYFGNPQLGGQSSQTDYCPVNSLLFIDSDISSHDCRNSANNDAAVPFQYQEEFGQDSICFTEANVGYPICYRHKCDADSRKLSINAFGSWRVCEDDFARITFGEFEIMCPRISMACPDLFCPRNCEGRGKCNWDAEGGAKCECFDSTDTSDFCSEQPGPSSSSSGAISLGVSYLWLVNGAIFISIILLR